MREANAVQEQLQASEADVRQEIGDEGREHGPAGGKRAEGADVGFVGGM